MASTCKQRVAIISPSKHWMPKVFLCNSSYPHKVVENSFSHSCVASGHQKLDIAQMEEKVDALERPMYEVKRNLRREILELEEKLQDQVAVRHSLEKALGYRPVDIDASNHLIPKPAQELIREIAVLELEVMHLESRVLSLYQRACDHQNSTLDAPMESKPKCTPRPQQKLIQEAAQRNLPHDKPVLAKSFNMIDGFPNKLSGMSVFRSHSALSQRAICSALMTPEEAKLTGYSEKLCRFDVYRCHSELSQSAVHSALRSSQAEFSGETHLQPLSFLEDGTDATSQVLSLAECLGTRISDHVPETPNRLSEDLLRCIGSIYCELVEPPVVHTDVSSSLTSSLSTISTLSPQFPGYMWSPVGVESSSYDARLENPFQVQGLREFGGPYSAMIEVQSISTDANSWGEINLLLKTFKSIIRRLEKIDARKMKNEEKLAFWINIYNALVMQTYIQQGIPHNYLKKSSLLLKANCKIGGRVVNADIIRSSILGHRTHHSGQWLRALLSPKLKLRAGGEWQAYAIEQSEPLLHFALCSGNHSDPAVRIYNPKRIYQQLETAKEEYIRAAVSIHNQKIMLPKVLESFVKDSSLSPAATVEMIQLYLPEKLRLATQGCQVGTPEKCIQWVSYDFSFRYLLSREMAGPVI